MSEACLRQLDLMREMQAGRLRGLLRPWPLLVGKEEDDDDDDEKEEEEESGGGESGAIIWRKRQMRET